MSWLHRSSPPPGSVDMRGHLDELRSDGPVWSTAETAWTFPYLSRVAPQNDDINYFDLSPESGNSRLYVLDLQPGLDWSAYQRLKVYHHGARMELFIRYADSNTFEPVGSTPPPTDGAGNFIWGDSDFVLPTTSGRRVNGLQLKFSPPFVGCAPGWCRQHLGSIRLSGASAVAPSQP